MVTLFLLAFLRANGAKADQFFKDCIDDPYNSANYNYYESLLKYPFDSETNITRGDWLQVCCNNNTQEITPLKQFSLT